MENNTIGRRHFLKSSLAGFGGVFFLSSLENKPTGKSVDVKGKEKKWAYRTLGKTGLTLPVINMGVMNSDNPNLIRAALDSGVLLLDTAHAYMQGRNEEVIGGVIKGRPRDSYLIASKVSLPQDRTTGRYLEGATEGEFLKKLDLSLKRLGIDHVDILYHHGVSRRESVFYEPVLNAMAKAKKEGKLRFAGLTTHTNEPEVIHAAVDSKFYEVVMTSYNYQQKHLADVRDAIARAAQAGLGIIGMKAIRGGFRQTPSVKNPAAALKWVLQDPNVHTIVPGFTTFDQMDTDLAVMEDLGLSDSEKEDLLQEASLPSLYCQGCRQCLGQCVAGIPIPDLMRAYMYVYDYRNLGLAQDLVVSLALPPRVCEDCSSCPVNCSVGFPVREKIRDIARIREIPPEFIA
ncbi:MAG: aldo/keto reductase [Smithellaceae bacterium]|nr:aldo/keto reductase [Smithellaceae bacterium]